MQLPIASDREKSFVVGMALHMQMHEDMRKPSRSEVLQLFQEGREEGRQRKWVQQVNITLVEKHYSLLWAIGTRGRLPCETAEDPLKFQYNLQFAGNSHNLFPSISLALSLPPLNDSSLHKYWWCQHICKFLNTLPSGR